MDEVENNTAQSDQIEEQTSEIAQPDNQDENMNVDAIEPSAIPNDANEDLIEQIEDSNPEESQPQAQNPNANAESDDIAEENYANTEANEIVQSEKEGEIQANENQNSSDNQTSQYSKSMELASMSDAEIMSTADDLLNEIRGVEVQDVNVESEVQQVQQLQDMVDQLELVDEANPLIGRVQETLKSILTQRHQKLDLEMSEKNEALRKIINDREMIGVDLYHMQQELARLQTQLESSQESFDKIQQKRLVSEEQFKIMNEQHQSEYTKWLSQNKNLERHKLDLEKLTRHLKQVSKYQEDLRSEILIAKKSTLQSEKDLLKKELEKKKQDYFVDKLSEQLRQLQERDALYQTQLAAQKKETKAATETLQEAALEMDAIFFEKKGLMHQWKSSLIGLQRRNDSYNELAKAIQKEKDNLLTVTMELNGFKHSLRKQQDQQETLTQLLAKLESEIDHSKKQIQQISENKEKLKESYNLYSKSLSQTQNDLSIVNSEKASVRQELNLLNKANNKLVSQIKQLENEIMDQLQNQVSLVKSNEGTRKDGKKLKEVIHEKEAQIAQIENDVAVAKSESLKTQSRIDGYKELLLGYDKELKEKNELIERYEIESRRKSDELSKKQSEVDLLNKKFDQIMGQAVTPEAAGPLEATIHQLGKLIQEKEVECRELQKFWMKSQYELVQYSKNIEGLQEDVEHSKVKINILQRKKIHLTKKYEVEEKDHKQYLKKIRHLQNDMTKINAILMKHVNIKEQLEENNLGLEIQFRARLKDAELDANRLETEFHELREAKKQLLENIVEAERQIMLWEKKLQMAKETQEALDPNIGSTEIKEMTMEIHRMTLRLAQVRKLQEKLVAEMDLCLHRHEAISVKSLSQNKGTMILALQKQVQELNKNLKGIITEIKEKDKGLQVLNESYHRLEDFVNESKRNCDLLLDKRQDVSGKLQKLETVREKNVRDLIVLQKQLKRHVEMKDGRYVYACQDFKNYNEDLNKQKEKLEKINSILLVIEDQRPDLKPFTQSLLQNQVN